MTTDSPISTPTPGTLFTQMKEGLIAAMAADAALNGARDEDQMDRCVQKFDQAVDQTMNAFGEMVTRGIIEEIAGFLAQQDEATTSGSAVA